MNFQLCINNTKKQMETINEKRNSGGTSKKCVKNRDPGNPRNGQIYLPYLVHCICQIAWMNCATCTESKLEYKKVKTKNKKSTEAL